MKENILSEKSLQFSVRIIKLAQFLESKSHLVMANQILRSGTSIGANVSESAYAASNADFINKLKLAEKEANETIYWLKLLRAVEILDEK